MITNVSYFKANFAMILSSSSLNTFPVGFDGLHRIIAFGFCLKAFSKTFTSKLKLAPMRGTYIGSAPDNMASAP